MDQARTFGPRWMLWIAFAALTASAATAQTSRVFVTSTQQNGNLGGLDGADAVCNSLASGAGLDGSWTAWLSTSSVDAKDRLNPSSGPFVLVGSGAVVAQNIAGLTDGSLETRITLDETGNPPCLCSDGVWTGTLGNGTTSMNTCADWSTAVADPNILGTYGLTNGPSAGGWTNEDQLPCSFDLRLYCFEAVPVAESIPTASEVGLAVLTALLLIAGTGFLRKRESAV